MAVMIWLKNAVKIQQPNNNINIWPLLSSSAMKIQKFQKSENSKGLLWRKTTFVSGPDSLQYGLFHCYDTLMGPDYKLTYFEVHQSLLQTPLVQPVSTPLFSTTLYPGLFCSKTHRSQLRSALATKDAKHESFQMNYTFHGSLSLIILWNSMTFYLWCNNCFLTDFLALSF